MYDLMSDVARQWRAKGNSKASQIIKGRGTSYWSRKSLRTLEHGQLPLERKQINQVFDRRVPSRYGGSLYETILVSSIHFDWLCSQAGEERAVRHAAPGGNGLKTTLRKKLINSNTSSSVLTLQLPIVCYSWTQKILGQTKPMAGT